MKVNTNKMLRPEQKLNPKIFDKDVEKVSLRVGFGDGLLEAGQANDQVVGLCADLTGSTKMDKFAHQFPERYIEIGVAEQNLVTVASGLAHMGKIPFTSSYAMFSPGRNWEQIRTTVCYNDVPVKIVGSHAGVSVGPDGGTHQPLEDIALMRVLPRMVVVAPADVHEAKKATLAIARNGKPSYLRLARNNSPVVTTEESPFEIGKANVLWHAENPKVAIISCGPMVARAMQAAKAMHDKGLDSIVVNCHTIKPLDEETILKVAKKAGAVVTVEEHQKAGGLGSTVAELLACHNPVPMEILGINDEFGQSGDPEELLDHYGLNEKGIREAVARVLERVKS